MPIPKIKGRVVIESLEAARSLLGEDVVNRVIARLDRPLQEILEAGLHKADWYPLEVLTQFWECQISVLGFDEGLFAERVRELSEQATERQLGREYRALVVSSPESWIRRHIAFQQTYCRDLPTSVVSMEPKMAVLRLTGLEKKHRLAQPLFLGFIRKSLEMAGATNPRAEFVVPIGDPSGNAEVRITWE